MIYIPLDPSEKRVLANIQLKSQSGDIADIIATNNNYGLVTVTPSHISTDNSTSTTLGSGETFTGEWEDITNFGVIVVTVYSDVVSATDGLDVEMSTDGVNIDSSDLFSIPSATGKTFSFQTATRYFRVKYTNGASAQSEFRLQSILKPYYVKPSSHRINDSIVSEDDAELVKAVLTGEDTDGIFKNVGLQLSGALRTSIEDGQTGRRLEVEPLGSLKSITPIRLVGTTFSNGTKDTNFWVESVTGTGTVSQAGQIELSTGTTADSTAKYYTSSKARKVTGTTNQFRSIAGLTTNADANNIRRIGAYDDNNGFFIQINGTTTQVASRKNGSDTTVSSGSFNGNYGLTWTPLVNTLYRLTIDYTANSAKFFVNDMLLHTISNTTSGFVNTQNYPVTIENINSGGNTTDNKFVVQFATILRLGELETESKYKYLGTNATTVCKYNAGRLNRIINVDNAGTVTIYDNTAASGDVIAVIDTAKALGTLEFGVPFSNGLTIVTALNAKVVAIYE